MTTASTTLAATNRFYDRTEALPLRPPAGDYVVVDVCYFSTTVVELLAGGATGVYVPETSGELFEYRAARPRALVGGEPGVDASHPKPGHDIQNSPSFVRGVDVDDRPVALTSHNGGRCVATLAACDDVTVYVGSTTNAPALAAHLADRDRPTYYVAAGSDGDRAPEDEAGAALVAAFHEVDVEYDPEVARAAILDARQDRDSHPVRRSDLERHATAVGYRDVVPRLEDDHLVDVTAQTRPPEVEAATATGALDPDEREDATNVDENGPGDDATLGDDANLGDDADVLRGSLY